MSIGDSAFSFCKNLLSITIPNTVSIIGGEAFYMCENLQSVTIPDSVTSISDSAFDYCYQLTIHGAAGSYAERYAKQNNIPFIAE